jgi:ABC-type nitrate/sulfonate/bicarbonate transport system substrate-binding protein
VAVAIVLALGAAVLIGVGARRAEPAAGKTEKVILASGLAAPFIQYMTAVDKGFLKKHDVNAEYKIFPSGAEAVVAVGAGEAHVSNGSCPTAIINKGKGSNLLVVARNIVNPAEHGLAVYREIQKPEDLKGKKVGALVGSSSDWYATRYMEVFGLRPGPPPDGVTILNIAAPEWIPAVQRRDIVGFFGWEPWVSKLPSVVNGTHIIHRSNQNNVLVIMNCLVFNADWVRNDPASAEATLKGLVEAHDAVMANLDEAVSLASRPMRIPEKDLRQMVNCCTYKVDFTLEFVDHARQAAAWTKSKGMLKDDPEVVLKSLLHPALLRKVAPERVTVKE